MALFGFLSMIVVFAVTTGIVSSRHHTIQDNYSQEEDHAHERQAGGGKTFWQALDSDPTAFFTAVLAVLTAVLAGTGIIQIRFLINADRVARLSARAAISAANATRRSVEIAAHAAEVSESALLNVERPYLFVTGPAMVEYSRDQGEGDIFFVRYSIANYGRLPAIIREARISVSYLHEGKPLPPPAVADGHRLSIEPYIKSDFRVENILEYVNNALVIKREFVGDDVNDIYKPIFDGVEMISFQVIIDYDGPFSKGHSTDNMWLLFGEEFWRRGEENYNR